MLKNWLAAGDKRNLALMGLGTIALLRGNKLTAAATFGLGAAGLELVYRERNGFDGDFAERWQRAMDFYAETHQDETNKAFHMAGIPVIVASTLGLLIARPGSSAWKASLYGFIGGWASNFVGHAIEGSAPALVDDPLSFLAGPASDLMWITQNDDHDEPAEPAAQPNVRAAA